MMDLSGILGAASIASLITLVGNFIANRCKELHDVRARHDTELREAYADFSGSVEEARALARFLLVVSRPHHDQGELEKWTDRANERVFDLLKRLRGACAKLFLLEDNAELPRKADTVMRVFVDTLTQIAVFGCADSISLPELQTQIERAAQMFDVFESEAADACALARARSASWLPAFGARRFANQRRRASKAIFPSAVNAMTAEAGPDTAASPAAES